MADNYELSNLYDTAFSCLAKAQSLDCGELESILQSVPYYQQACSIFRKIVNIENAIGGKPKPFGSISYEKEPANGKVLLLQGQIDNFEQRLNEIDFLKRSQRNSSLSNTKTSSSGTSFDSMSVQLTLSDSAMEKAVLLDEKLMKSNPIDIYEYNSNISRCVELYMSAAEQYIQLIKQNPRADVKKRVDDILSRIEDLKRIQDSRSGVRNTGNTAPLLQTGQVTPVIAVHANKNECNTSNSGSSGTELSALQSLLDTLPDIPGSAPRGTIPKPVSPPPAPSAPMLPVETPKISPISSPSLALSVTPTSAGPGLNELELQILKKSSFINSHVYHPWLPREELNEVFRLPELFCDPDGLLELSDEQKKAGAIWLRPHEIIERLNSSSTKNSSSSSDGIAPKLFPVVPDKILSALEVEKPVYFPPNFGRITQDLVADCSFVCSLCIIAAYEDRFIYSSNQTGKKRAPLLNQLLFPQASTRFLIPGADGKPSTGSIVMPIYNPFGKYLIKLYVNGVPRKVVIDDRLPYDPVRNKLLCTYSRSPQEFWISLIEKAYMKLNGGYNFPGSNSGIDVYALTGWIPEQVYFASSQSSNAEVLDFKQTSDRAWARLSSAFNFGDCLVTISTSSKLTEEEEKVTGLVAGHAYAVLDVRDVNNGALRILKVKNPWARRPWRGKFSVLTAEDIGKESNLSDDCVIGTEWTDGLKRLLLGGTDRTTNLHYDKLFREMYENGIFWIEFSDCLKYFKSVFLNWNPSLFAYRTVFHDIWSLSMGPANDTYYCGANPQYSLIVDNPNPKIPVNNTVWVLFSRHLTVKEATEQGRSDGVDGSDFFALHVYKGDGLRVYSPVDKPFIKGVYSNDPHVLIRIDSHNKDDWLEQPGSAETAFTLVISQTLKKRDASYSISVFSTSLPFRCRPAPGLPVHQMSIVQNPGWTLNNTSGGTPKHWSFYKNPQYRLMIGANTNGSSNMVDVHIQALYPKEISAIVYLLGDDEDTTDNSRPIGVYRKDRVIEDHEIIPSDTYRPGFNYLSGRVECNKCYTVVFSTFTPSMNGPFHITAAVSTRDYKFIEIPAEGHGMREVVIKGRWDSSNGTAAGCNNFGNYLNNPIYRFKITKSGSSGNGTILMFARLVCPHSPGITTNISLYPLTRNNHTSRGDYFPHPKASPKKRVIATSGDGVYNDTISGVTLPLTTLSYGAVAEEDNILNHYCLIPSTFDPNVQADFVIYLYCEPQECLSIELL